MMVFNFYQLLALRSLGTKSKFYSREFEIFAFAYKEIHVCVFDIS